MKNELYFTFMDLLGGGVDASAGTDAGHHAGPHLLNIGFAFFVLLVMASYTANLAAMLATDNLKSDTIRSLEDCAEQKCTLCIYYKVEADLKALYDTTGMNVVPWSSTTAMIQAAIDGSCDATIFDWDGYKAHYGAYDGLCDLYFEGTQLISMPVAQPCAVDLEKGLSYWIRATTLDGTWGTIINDVRPAPPASCDPFVSDTANMNSGQLGLSNFAMPFSSAPCSPRWPSRWTSAEPAAATLFGVVSFALAPRRKRARSSATFTTNKAKRTISPISTL